MDSIMIQFTVNGKNVNLDVDSDTPLLWAIRDELKLFGTKFGCGVGLCGSCTVHVDGNAVRSCSFPVSAAEGKKVTTIEGLSEDASHPIQIAWTEVNVPQCGYCQPGQIMAAAALLKNNPNADAEQIKLGMTNICRCGTYGKINQAVLNAGQKMNKQEGQ